MSSLEPTPEDAFDSQASGYDMRQSLLAEDPVAAAYALFLQIRTALAMLQYAALKGDAEIIEAELVQAEELKQLLGAICEEQHPVVEQFHKERCALEANFQTYLESTEGYGSRV